MQLSIKQNQAVECLDNCLVLACPGSGKSRVLVNKTEHILRVDPAARILITSFTKDSAAEMRHRITSAIGSQLSGQIATGTFHSIAFDQIKRHGFKGNIVSPGQMRQYVERALIECRLPAFDIDEAISLIETLKSDPDYEPGTDEHSRIFLAYTDLIKRNNVIDFSDMLARAVRLMRNKEIKPKAANYLLVDESQDLDEMQYAWCAEHIKNGSIFTVVGDDDQSIYKFRRALGYDGMMRFKEDYGAKVITLDTNYRCKAEILMSAGEVIKNNTKRVPKDLRAERGKGGETQVWQCQDGILEGILCAKTIQDWIKQSGGPSMPDDSGKSLIVPHGSWAIFARNNHNLTKVMIALDAAGIAYQSNSPSIWDKPPVCFALALLSSLVTKQKAGFDSALHFAGVDEETLIQLHEEYGDSFDRLFEECVVDEVAYGKGTASNLSAFASNVKKWLNAIEKDRVSNAIRGVFQWFADHVEQSINDKKNNGKDNKGGNSGQRNLDMLLTAKECMAQMQGDLSARISRLTRKQKKENAGVFVGTMHASKGLEFDNVWLIAIDDGTVPDIKEWTPDTHEEERRLFYVGMTRAKNSLYISFSKAPSSFITESGLDIDIAPVHFSPTKTEYSD